MSTPVSSSLVPMAHFPRSQMTTTSRPKAIVMDEPNNIARSSSPNSPTRTWDGMIWIIVVMANLGILLVGFLPAYLWQWRDETRGFSYLFNGLPSKSLGGGGSGYNHVLGVDTAGYDPSSTILNGQSPWLLGTPLFLKNTTAAGGEMSTSSSAFPSRGGARTAALSSSPTSGGSSSPTSGGSSPALLATELAVTSRTLSPTTLSLFHDQEKDLGVNKAEVARAAHYATLMLGTNTGNRMNDLEKILVTNGRVVSPEATTTSQTRKRGGARLAQVILTTTAESGKNVLTKSALDIMWHVYETTTTFRTNTNKIRFTDVCLPNYVKAEDDADAHAEGDAATSSKKVLCDLGEDHLLRFWNFDKYRFDLSESATVDTLPNEYTFPAYGHQSWQSQTSTKAAAAVHVHRPSVMLGFDKVEQSAEALVMDFFLEEAEDMVVKQTSDAELILREWEKEWLRHMAVIAETHCAGTGYRLLFFSSGSSVDLSFEESLRTATWTTALIFGATLVVVVLMLLVVMVKWRLFGKRLMGASRGTTRVNAGRNATTTSSSSCSTSAMGATTVTSNTNTKMQEEGQAGVTTTMMKMEEGEEDETTMTNMTEMQKESSRRLLMVKVGSSTCVQKIVINIAQAGLTTFVGTSLMLYFHIPVVWLSNFVILPFVSFSLATCRLGYSYSAWSMRKNLESFVQNLRALLLVAVLAAVNINENEHVGAPGVQHALLCLSVGLIVHILLFNILFPVLWCISTPANNAGVPLPLFVNGQDGQQVHASPTAVEDLETTTSECSHAITSCSTSTVATTSGAALTHYSNTLDEDGKTTSKKSNASKKGVETTPTDDQPGEGREMLDVEKGGVLAEDENLGVVEGMELGMEKINNSGGRRLLSLAFNVLLFCAFGGLSVASLLGLGKYQSVDGRHGSGSQMLDFLPEGGDRVARSFVETVIDLRFREKYPLLSPQLRHHYNKETWYYTVVYGHHDVHGAFSSSWSPDKLVSDLQHVVIGGNPSTTNTISMTSRSWYQAFREYAQRENIKDSELLTPATFGTQVKAFIQRPEYSEKYGSDVLFREQRRVEPSGVMFTDYIVAASRFHFSVEWTEAEAVAEVDQRLRQWAKATLQEEDNQHSSGRTTASSSSISSSSTSSSSSGEVHEIVKFFKPQKSSITPLSETSRDLRTYLLEHVFWVVVVLFSFACFWHTVLATFFMKEGHSCMKNSLGRIYHASAVVDELEDVAGPQVNGLKKKIHFSQGQQQLNQLQLGKITTDLLVPILTAVQVLGVAVVILDTSTNAFVVLAALISLLLAASACSNSTATGSGSGKAHTTSTGTVTNVTNTTSSSSGQHFLPTLLAMSMVLSTMVVTSAGVPVLRHFAALVTCGVLFSQINVNLRVAQMTLRVMDTAALQCSGIRIV
ncbi:unnamed protein product [Amoebophrya sp. A25]|nr:unnamed protein product [Amoebophrya sp. A25]|eukprot:GSA25T00016373001.1